MVTWNKLAEICNQHINKGSKLFIAGRLHLLEWEGKDGTQHAKVEIVANSIIFLTPKKIVEQGQSDIAELPEDCPF